MKITLIVFLQLVIFLRAYSQNIQKIKSIQISTPTEVSIDKSGNIYYSTFNGDIVKYDPLLKDQIIYSPSNPGAITTLEASHGLRIFSFHKDLQIYRLMNRSLSLSENYNFPENIIGFAETATVSYDNNIWVVDQIDFSLNKYDIFSKTITSRTQLNQLIDPDNYSILHCKEYQNRLFISTKDHGILIFDNFGNYIKTFQFINVPFFNFQDNWIYFLNADRLIKKNLYDDKIIEIELQSQKEWLFALVFEDLIYLFSTNRIVLYK